MGTAVAGCSFLVSTDGLSGTVIVIVGGDGGGSDTGPAFEAGSGDASTPDVADAGPPPPFCASLSPKPVLCADFDDGALTDYGDIQGGPPTLDTTVSTSAPQSMLAVVEADAVNRFSKVAHAYTATPTSLQGTFSIYVDEYDVTHDVELVAVQLAPNGTKSCIVTVAIRQNEWTLDESCDMGSTSLLSVSHSSSIFMKKNRWTRVSFAADFSARALSLSIDDQRPFAGLAMGGPLANGPHTFGMGIAYLQTNATRAKVHFDDVVYDFH